MDRLAKLSFLAGELFENFFAISRFAEAEHEPEEIWDEEETNGPTFAVPEDFGGAPAVDAENIEIDEEEYD